jgi:DNA-binding NarL/FixJ family response regulator
MIKVLIATEKPFVGSLISSVIEDEPDIGVVGKVTSVEEALEKLEELNPDMLVASTTMAENGAMRLTKELSTENPDAKILIVGLAESKENILQYIEAGAHGFVLESHSVDELLEGIRAAHAEEAIVSPRIAAFLMQRLTELSQFLEGIDPSIVEEAGLTDREMEVLQLIGEGHTNKQIADQLVIELGTVKAHVHNILDKLDVSSRRDAAAYLAIVREDPAG